MLYIAPTVIIRCRRACVFFASFHRCVNGGFHCFLLCGKLCFSTYLLKLIPLVSWRQAQNPGAILSQRNNWKLQETGPTVRLAAGGRQTASYVPL